MGIIEFYNVKATAVNVKMNVAFFKVRSYSLPYLNLWVQFFYRTPCSVANSFAVGMRRNKQYYRLIWNYMVFYFSSLKPAVIVSCCILDGGVLVIYEIDKSVSYNHY
ncbi:hypothetical protein SAMN05216587_101336 [Selenomonas ruminantium]|uniref:Uncharacterized protein n=1 Tax=Selenomonas ruminantium TaxID=971 RepID=A0A1I0V786_SELRU|nr:hypothetical protein SAMN05216587_101336 [Selenomonas ruminantium]